MFRGLILLLVLVCLASSESLGRTLKYRRDCDEPRFETGFEFHNNKCYKMIIGDVVHGSRKVSCNETYVTHHICSGVLDCSKCNQIHAKIGCDGFWRTKKFLIFFTKLNYFLVNVEVKSQIQQLSRVNHLHLDLVFQQEMVALLKLLNQFIMKII